MSGCWARNATTMPRRAMTNRATTAAKIGGGMRRRHTGDERTLVSVVRSCFEIGVFGPRGTGAGFGAGAGLATGAGAAGFADAGGGGGGGVNVGMGTTSVTATALLALAEIGRASCRERVESLEWT